MALTYILVKYNLEGHTYIVAPSFDNSTPPVQTDPGGLFQNVTVVLRIDGDTKGSLITPPVCPIKLDTSLSLIDALSAFPGLVQAWVDSNYNS